MVLAHGFELFVAVAALLTALQFITDPTARMQAAVGSIGETFAWGWTILYMLGSLGVIGGLLRPDDRWELAGLMSFSAAALVNAASLFQVRGASGGYVALTFLAFVFGAATRIHLLLTLRRITSTSSKNSGR
jgi:hypothetical protein